MDGMVLSNHQQHMPQAGLLAKKRNHGKELQRYMLEVYARFLGGHDRHFFVNCTPPKKIMT